MDVAWPRRLNTESLLVSQRFDRIHPRGDDRGIQTETDPNQTADDEAAGDGPCRDARRIGSAAESSDDPRQTFRDRRAESDADQAAAETDDRGLDQELQR